MGDNTPEERIEKRKEECSLDTHSWISEKNICVQNIKTIEIFLQKPLVGSLAIALIAYFFAAFLYKIKGMPLEKSNKQKPYLGKYIKCGTIDVETLLFSTSPELGIVQKEAYLPGKQNKYGKIFWPWLSEYLYPPKPNKDESGKLDGFYVFMLPFYLTLKWTTMLYYSSFCAIKNTFYKADHWGSLSEINKINKKLWLSDLFVVFLCIPILLSFVMPMLFVIILMIAMIIAPIRSIVWNFGKGSDFIRGKFPDPTDEEGEYRAWYVLKMVFWCTIAWIAQSAVTSMGIFILHILWFASILMGSQEAENDGLKTIIKTWANIIWDYKFIWAILAAMLWLNNFKSYLYGQEAADLGVNGGEGPLSFIKEDNQGMIIGTVSGAILILLMLQQSKYYGSLSNNKPKSRNCGDDCSAPMGESEDGEKKSEKCPNPTYDPTKYTFLGVKTGKIKEDIKTGFRKKMGANKTDEKLAEEKRIEYAKKEKTKSETV